MLRQLFRREKKPKVWKHDQKDLPWLDQPNALAQIDARLAAGKLSESDAQRLRDWHRDGYLVIDGAVPEATIDALNTDIDALWSTDTPVHGLVIKDLFLNEGDAKPTPDTPHEALLRYPVEERMKINKRGRWRIHGLHFQNQNAKSLFDNAEAHRMVNLILGRETPCRYSITFMWGSQQHLHQDLMVFHIHPLNFLVGCWIALEDVSPDCGPLVYYPGSHREPLYHEFNNYPQTNVRTATHEQKARYEADLDKVAEKYERKIFCAKKGQMILWHAMLIHGGEGIRTPGITRRSFVTHFIPPETDKAEEMIGPFLW